MPDLLRTPEAGPVRRKGRRAPAVRLAALALFAILIGAAPSRAGDLAIVVHADVPVAEVSLSEARNLLLAERQFWTPDLRVTILMGAPGSRERSVVVRTICRMTEAQFRQYWISKVFRAETPSAPKIVYTTESATDLVSRIPGAIAIVDAQFVPKGMKVLKIDGRLPGEEGYELR